MLKPLNKFCRLFAACIGSLCVFLTPDARAESPSDHGASVVIIALLVVDTGLTVADIGYGVGGEFLPPGWSAAELAVAGLQVLALAEPGTRSDAKPAATGALIWTSALAAHGFVGLVHALAKYEDAKAERKFNERRARFRREAPGRNKGDKPSAERKNRASGASFSWNVQPLVERAPTLRAAALEVHGGLATLSVRW